MRVWLWITTLLLVLLAACSTEPAKEFAWQRIDTTVDVQRNGDLHVTEVLTVRYTSGTFSFGTRDIADGYLAAITDISVESDDQRYQQTDDPETTTPYTVSATDGDGMVHVRWAYPPTMSGERTFTLRYRAVDAVHKEKGNNPKNRSEPRDIVWWSMVFPQRDRPVEQAIGRIQFPSDVPVNVMEATTPDVPGAIVAEPGVVLVNATNVPPGEELTLRVTFPQTVIPGDSFFVIGDNSAINAAPIVEDMSDENRQVLGWFLLIAGCIAFIVFMTWLNHHMGWETSADSSSQSRSWRSSSRSNSSTSRSGSSGSRGRGGGGASGGGGGSMG